MLSTGLIFNDFGHISLALQYQLLKFLLLVGSILGTKLFRLASFVVNQRKYRTFTQNWQLFISRDIENSRFRDLWFPNSNSGEILRNLKISWEQWGEKWGNVSRFWEVKIACLEIFLNLLTTRHYIHWWNTIRMSHWHQ